jgi:diguanylate cyclase (GGDEF)-like protein
MDNLENSARPANTQLAVRDAHEAFARLTRLARRELNAPEALISLLEDGTEPVPGDGTVRQEPLAYGLCHCVVDSGEPLVIVETRAQGHPDEVVAFAGVPLREPSGRTVGTLGVLDHRPRRWTDAELRFLGQLGRAAETEIALRAAPSQLSSPAVGRGQADTLRIIAANLPGMVYRFTRNPSGELGLAFASEGAREIFGREAAELMADPQLAIDAIHPEDREAYRRSAEDSARTRSRWDWRGRIVQPDGTVKHVRGASISTLDARGNCVWDGVLVDETHAHEDISERSRYEERLRHMLDHDPLTGLLNRRGFEVALNAHLAHVRRYGGGGALLVLDLDGFKLINDTLGHAVGDQLIITCARALSSRLRESDVVARLGGDEFAILVPAGTEDEAKTVAQATIDTIRARSEALSGAHVGRVTASVGIAPLRGGALTADEMLVNADLAMYDAKAAGKDRYSVFGADGHAIPRIKAHMSWLERIRRALAEDRYCLYVQPVVELASGRATEYEVLVRMVDEDGRLITPGRFLYIAERFGVIGELDRWIVSHSIRAMAEAKAHGQRLALAVNISGGSAGEEALLETIAGELAAAELDASDLTLEITESAAVADIPRARRFAEALTRIGCRLALDDFGAGLGSLYYLKHLPFDALKIDGEFVRHALENPADRLVIKAVTDIARGLGKQTIAELVPNEQTVQLLLELGVDCAQGFFLGRPRPIGELLAQPALSR